MCAICGFAAKTPQGLAGHKTSKEHIDNLKKLQAKGSFRRSGSNASVASTASVESATSMPPCATESDVEFAAQEVHNAMAPTYVVNIMEAIYVRKSYFQRSITYIRTYVNSFLRIWQGPGPPES